MIDAIIIAISLIAAVWSLLLIKGIAKGVISDIKKSHIERKLRIKNEFDANVARITAMRNSAIFKNPPQSGSGVPKIVGASGYSGYIGIGGVSGVSGFSGVSASGVDMMPNNDELRDAIRDAIEKEKIKS